MSGPRDAPAAVVSATTRVEAADATRRSGQSSLRQSGISPS